MTLEDFEPEGDEPHPDSYDREEKAWYEFNTWAEIEHPQIRHDAFDFSFDASMIRFTETMKVLAPEDEMELAAAMAKEKTRNWAEDVETEAGGTILRIKTSDFNFDRI